MKFALELGGAGAECLECDFKLGPSLEPRHISCSTEMPGQITEVICHASAEVAISYFIAGFRDRTIRGKDL